MKNYIIANLKMYLSRKEKVDYWIENFIKNAKNINLEGTEIIICPPAIFFESIYQALKQFSFVSFGLQNCFWENEGSYTGEISPSMLVSSSGRYAILGHSERRKYLKENNEQVALKIKQALHENIRPILCIGETLDEKKADMTVEVIKKQLSQCLKYVNQGKIEDIIICYEPVWAISSNGPARLPSSNEIMGVKLLIKKILTEKYNAKSIEKIAIIYGGSVDSKKIDEACFSPGMQGALIGKASSLPFELIKIAQIFDSVDMSVNKSFAGYR